MNICIDIGHTGICAGCDPGAVGHAGTKEADIVLKVGKLIKEKLSNECNVMLTRETDDLSIDELWTRVKMAEDFSADLFISLHCNAAESMQAHGYEVFIYTGDTASVPLAQFVYSSIEKAFPEMDGRGIKEARFGVLNGEFPSILVEMAFITNVNEEAILASAEGQEQFAEAIARGILWTKNSL